MRPRTGSVYYSARQRGWVGAVSLGGGRRRYFYGRSDDEVRAKMAEAGEQPPTHMPARAQRLWYRAAATRVALGVLERAEELGWDLEMTARVLAASMTKARVRAGVSGPCVYCGDEMADTVDHVVPSSLGGTDDPDNLVSACGPCNYRKGKGSPESVAV